MSENRIEETVRNAVAQALERQLATLRESVVQEVLRQIGSTPGGKPALETNSTAALQKAISAIQLGTTQKEILRTLLDNMIVYSGRAALFVIKAGAASGWQGIAFSNNESIKDFPLDASSGIAAAVLQSRTTASGNVSEFDQKFMSKFGAPAGGGIVLLPLLLKDKVSALVYADAGLEGGALDTAALDVLVRATSAWLEVISQRKQAQREGGLDGPEISHAAPANDPFASHPPSYVAQTQAVQEAAPAAAMSAAAAWGGPSSVPAGEDSEVHRKAQRFARLLMDEIKLYNQAKVVEGRKHKDLYDRLKDDIEKSRTTYQKRYGSTAAASADYFSQELIRSLAEDDVALLGSNFRR